MKSKSNDMKQHGVLRRGWFTSDGMPKGWIFSMKETTDGRGDVPILSIMGSGAVLLRGELSEELTLERIAAMNNECKQPRAWPDRTVVILNHGDTAIVVDDHCYAVRNWNGNEWGWTARISREELKALKALPDDPDALW